MRRPLPIELRFPDSHYEEVGKCNAYKGQKLKVTASRAYKVQKLKVTASHANQSRDILSERLIELNASELSSLGPVSGL
jgi:hypothetical protein